MLQTMLIVCPCEQLWALGTIQHWRI